MWRATFFLLCPFCFSIFWVLFDAFGNGNTMLERHSLGFDSGIQRCPPVEPNRGVDRGPTGFFAFRIEFGLQLL